MRNVNNSIRALANQFFFFRVYSISANASASRNAGELYVETYQNITPQRTFTERRDNEISTISLAPPPPFILPHQSPVVTTTTKTTTATPRSGENATLYTSLHRDRGCVRIGLRTPVRWCRMGEGRWARWSVGANIHYRFGGV